MSVTKYNRTLSEPYGESVMDFYNKSGADKSDPDSNSRWLQENEEKTFYTRECIICHNAFNSPDGRKQVCSKECLDKFRNR